MHFKLLYLSLFGFIRLKSYCNADCWIWDSFVLSSSFRCLLIQKRDDCVIKCAAFHMNGHCNHSFVPLFGQCSAFTDMRSENYDDFSCAYFNSDVCNGTAENCPTPETCENLGNSSQGCYAVWKYVGEQAQVMFKGCWTNEMDCDFDRCIAEEPSVDSAVRSVEVYFCCCNKPMCNREFQVGSKSFSETFSKIHRTNTTILTVDDSLRNVIFSLISVLLAAVLILIGFYFVRRYRLRFLLKSLESHSTALPKRLPLSLSNLPQRQIRLKDKISRGHYGCVYKATMGAQQIVVAVKVFSANNSDSWVQEQEIYAVPGLKSHPNILRFLGAEAHGTGPNYDYWLITEYHQRGSLHDYIKVHSISFQQLLSIGVSILRGLSFLHEEVVSTDKYKPTIVHRDFKSRNVLLKDDFTACVADFGLALKCEHGRTPNDTHGQVGTRRYMAPEVLEGATEFSAFAFRQIDVYAAALVLWELMSRCSLHGEEPDEYKLPFEVEVGLRPTLQVIQDTVATKKRRPIIKDSWRVDSHSKVVCATIEEMWDGEPEARISVGCAAERLNALWHVGADLDSDPKDELAPLMIAEQQHCDA
ncbi:Activin receptor type-2A [Trichinella murrelli]|uniref:Serine/threonine-protein kinase receptor n=1 Tax=Trichinella murrelli TaxID=144512 RepID=A0A0V0UH63_9BILA|nr:Activin receptor type-2A [Trichinella murrelli]